jgi:hypothetical protein
MLRRAVVLLAVGCGGGLTYYGPPGGDGPRPSSDAEDPVDTATTAPTSDSASTLESTGDSGTPPVPTAPAWTNGDPVVPPPYTELDPPALVRPEACVTIGLATSVPDGSGTVVVESQSDNNEVKDLSSPVTGWYDLYDLSLADSGASETNEIARIRVRNGLFPDGSSAYANCGSDWVGPDADNVGATGSELYYLGTFWFEPGVNTLDLQHFCLSIRQGICPELEDLSDPGSTCASDEENGVGLVADGLCLVEPEPG